MHSNTVRIQLRNRSAPIPHNCVRQKIDKHIDRRVDMWVRDFCGGMK